MSGAHLTSVRKDLEGHAADPWLASCSGCDWTQRTKRKHGVDGAITAAERHWLSMPVVTGWEAQEPAP
jgi:hypothetical protein